MAKIVIATGGFDPIHEGHIYYLRDSKAFGDVLAVGINSNEWLEKKKGFFFQDFFSRFLLIHHLRFVDYAFAFDDTDGTAKDAIRVIQKLYGDQHKYIFTNGGDRTRLNVPEMDVPNVEFRFGVGGDWKQNSSSEIAKRDKNGN